MNDVPRLHVVTDDVVLNRADFVDLAGQMTASDVVVHLRSRTLAGARLQELATNLRDRGTTGIVINDRVDVALAAGAVGVHLPEQGLPVRLVREHFRTSLLIGRSTHTPTDARRSLDEGADYVFLGPIWDTPTHAGAVAHGPGVFDQLRGLPVLAIGGVDPERARRCLVSGAYGIAVISAVWNHLDPVSVVHHFLGIIRDA